jgi:hypothetical protein
LEHNNIDVSGDDVNRLYQMLAELRDEVQAYRQPHRWSLYRRSSIFRL